MGGLAFADDVKMLCLTGMKPIYNICEKYTKEYNIKVNGSKSCLHLLKGRQCKASNTNLHVIGVAIQYVDSVMDLENAVSSNNRESMVAAAKVSFWWVLI